MAEPLTSSDIWRIQRGFGVSELASPEEKKRFAAAGVAPLTTGARQRFEEGRGISPMAGATEKEAWVAAEVLAGQRDPMELPKTYGGLGERPEATTRRGLRMQQEWDAQYKMILDQQEAARQAELQNRELAIRQRSLTLQEEQEARIQAAAAKTQEEEFKTSQQANAAMKEVMGGVDEQGNEIAPLDPDSPDYMKRRNDLIKRYPRAMYDDAFKSAIATTDKSYFDLLNFQQQQRLQEESAGRIAERQVAAETRAAEKQAGIRSEERKEAKEDVIVSQEREIDKQIRAQRQVLAGLQGQKPTKTLEKTATEASNKLLDLRIERAGLRGFAFEDQDAYKQAVDAGKKPPAGTTIYIGRKQVKVK